MNEQLLQLAQKPTNWERRDALLAEEEKLAQKYQLSVFSTRELQKVQRYLYLTSLPFRLVDTDEDELLEYAESESEILLRKLWKLKTVDSTAVLPTGNMSPDYFIIGDIPEKNQTIHRSFVQNVFVRKSLIQAKLYNKCWFTHLNKFPKLSLDDAKDKQIFEYIQTEIEVLKPALLIALGKKAKEIVNTFSTPSVVVTEPSYYIKHRFAYTDYAEAFQNVVDIYQERQRAKK